MRRKATRIDAVSIERATWLAHKRAVEAIQLADNLKKDPDKGKRLEKQLCRVCFYTRGARIAGAAMTICPCGLCGTDQLYTSTATDVLCLTCARGAHLCKHCGADLQGTPRRR